MTDREKVASELQSALECCQPEDNQNGSIAVKIWAVRDAIALLKEQEAVNPDINHGTWWFRCGKCKRQIYYEDKFCRHCGKMVKWG